MQYIALLRGINVGGNTKVAMPVLKQCFEAAGLEHVQTYINSGNIIFTSPETNKTKLVTLCETALEKQFGFPIACAVITADELRHALERAPAWWDADKTAKNNAIFTIAPVTTAQITDAIGAAKPEYEQVASVEPIIFWTAPLATFSRTRYSKIVGSSVYKSVTIRNANTTKKLLELCNQQIAG